MYRAVAKSGGQSEYDALLRLYKSAEEDIERKYVMLAMGSIPDAAIQVCGPRPMDWIPA